MNTERGNIAFSRAEPMAYVYVLPIYGPRNKHVLGDNRLNDVSVL